MCVDCLVLNEVFTYLSSPAHKQFSQEASVPVPCHQASDTRS